MAWTKEQQLAIDKKQGNILVAASAGSGKTAVLVERIINKIINEKVDIDKMLIVTFTKAAASEMKERILKAIYDKLDEYPDDMHLQKQLININKATITTMDSFFLEIVKSNFFECGLDPNISVCDDMQKYSIKEEVLDEIIEEEFEKENNDKFNTVFELISDGEEAKFKDIIYKLYNHIQSFPYPYIWLKEQIEKYNITDDIMKNECIKIIYEDVKEKLYMCQKKLEKAMEMFEYDETLVEKYTSRFEEDIHDIKLCINNSKDIDTLYDNLNSNLLSSNMPQVRNAVNPELKEIVSNLRKDVKERIKKLRKVIYAPSNILEEDLKETYTYLTYIYDLLIKLNEKMLEKKIEKNMLDFSDIAHKALDLLIERKEDKFGNEILIETEVAKRYKEKFDEIYIDEYQDSNYVQEYVLSAISKKTENMPNQFMVGDIKQSIYGFRQAMPEIFLDKYENYTEEEESNYTKIILSKNFRSRKQVLDPINYIFSKIMTKECGKCSYVGKERLSVGASYEEDETSNYNMEINVLDIINDAKDNANENAIKIENINQEAEFIAKRIKELVYGDEEKNILPLNVYDIKSKSENKFRKIEFKDIVILLRSNMKKNGKIIEEELKKNNIPVFCDSNASLFENDEINFILTFLELLDNVYQDIPLCAMMYSIIGKFTLNEMVKIRKNYKEGSLYEALEQATLLEDKEISEKAKNFLNLIEKYTYISKYFKISELLSMLYEETGIYEQFLLKDGGVQRCANLDALIDVAASFETLEYKGLYSFMEYVKGLKETKAGGLDAKIIGESENVVRIMTIHKSKGLEFPVVFLSNASGEFNMKDINQDEVILNHELGIGVNVIRDNKEFLTSYPSVIKLAIKEKNKRNLISEELRLLYVALTRAKEKLIITATKKNFEKNLNSKIYLTDNETGIIDSSCVFALNNYLDIIFLTLREYNKEKEDAKIDIYVHKCSNLTYEEEENNENEIDVFKKWEEFVNEIEIDEDDYEKLISKLDFDYAFKDYIDMQGKYTVSEIKKLKQDEEEISSYEDIQKSKEVMYKQTLKVPKFMVESIEYTPAQKGTLMHTVLEHIDFKTLNKDNINEYIQSLVDSNYILKEEVKYINKNSIEKYIDTEIFRLAKESKKVEKEKPFVYRKKASELIDVNVDEYVLLQGIIDMYIVDSNNEIILVDYKTDRLKNKEDFISKYKVQLELYKEALEKISGLKVSKVYIYALNIAEAIEIK